MSRIDFVAPVDLHLRPCAVIAQKAHELQRENGGLVLSISKSGKQARATSLVSLALLGIKQGDTFSVEITGGDIEKVEDITTAFKTLIDQKLIESHLHKPRERLLNPPGIDISVAGVRHPEHDKFQERYNFLIKAKALLEQNETFFCNQESLTEEEYKEKEAVFLDLRKEELSMLEAHSMSLSNGAEVAWLCRENRTREDRKNEYNRIMSYALPDSLIEAQRFLRILPSEVTDPIYQNLRIVTDMRTQLSHIESADNLWGLCQRSIESMTPQDRGFIKVGISHDLLTAYNAYNSWPTQGEPNVFNLYKQDVLDAITDILGHVQEFLYPTELRTYK